jgi:hypothetical protein
MFMNTTTAAAKHMGFHGVYWIHITTDGSSGASFEPSKEQFRDQLSDY